MKRVVLTIAAVALAAVTLPRPSHATSPFDQRLNPDQQIIHALNRLTFGPRPGDVEEVRRVGLTKWMELQLHPEQITENPVLEERLKPLESLRLTLPDVVAKYTPQQNMGMMMVQGPFEGINKLPQADRNKVMNGTAEERTAVLDAMEPEMRTRVLGALPPNVIAYTPKYKDEAEKARKAQQEERQAQNRKRNPQLRDLLTADQIADVRSGDKDKVLAVFAALDPDKRIDVAAQLPAEKPGACSGVPARRAVQTLAAAGGERRPERGPCVSRGLFEPATGRGAGGFLVQPLQCRFDQEHRHDAESGASADREL